MTQKKAQGTKPRAQGAKHGRAKGPQAKPKQPHTTRTKGTQQTKPKGAKGKNTQGRAKGPHGEAKRPIKTKGKAGRGRLPKSVGGIAINVVSSLLAVVGAI